MKASTSIETTTKRLFACPECGSMEHSYGHLKPGTTLGSWWCDECGCGVRGTINDDYSVDLELCSDRKINTLVLLQLFEPLQSGEPVYIIVHGLCFKKAGEPLAIGENDEYFYDMGTCPWNYLRVPIIHNGDTDPHGIFQHQETIIEPTQEKYRELCTDRVGGGQLDAHDLPFDALKKLFRTFSDEVKATPPIAEEG